MAASLFKWFSVYLFLLSGYGYKSNYNNIVTPAHPLYVTVTEINHNAKDKTLELSCKIFTNDFEAALEKTFHAKADLSEAKDKKATDKLVSDYIQKHFQIKADGKPVLLEFVGSEKETDATWSYFQVSNMATVKKLEITNNLLYETFEGEINIMHVTVSGNRKSEKLTSPETNVVFDF
jgi:uncharacterized protein DUF6702